MLRVQILLVHTGSALPVEMLNHFHRLIVHVLLKHRVLTRIIDVIRVMVMNSVVCDGQDVRALLSCRCHGGVHAISIRCNLIDVPEHDLLDDALPVCGLLLRPGELLHGLLLFPHHGGVLPRVVCGPLARELILDCLMSSLIVNRLLDEV